LIYLERLFAYDVDMSPTDPTATLTALAAVDVSHADSDQCARLLGDTKRLRGWLDAFEAKITRRAGELHESAGSTPAADLHTKCSDRICAAMCRRGPNAIPTSTP
jgi:hypothetical protein